MAPLYAAVLVFFVVVGLIPIQTRLFKAYGVVQPIRKELPADQQKKQGTPLMGGLIFITGAAAALCVGQSTYAVLLAVLFILFAFIGFLDDFKKAHTKSPDGISGRTKLVLQFVVYFAEILSVIIQVAYFKRTGKRIFRMSPNHYHFSLKYGWRENTIVLVFSGVSWACSLMCVAYYEVFMR